MIIQGLGNLCTVEKIFINVMCFFLKTSLLFFPSGMTFIYFSCLIELNKILSMILNRCSESGYLCLVSDIKGKYFTICCKHLLIYKSTLLLLVCWDISLFMAAEFCQTLFCICWDNLPFFFFSPFILWTTLIESWMLN